jgi:hypothetical protein
MSEILKGKDLGVYQPTEKEKKALVLERKRRAKALEALGKE